MKIEDVFGDYQNGNFNTNTNTNINQNKKTKLEDTLGYKSVNNGNDNYNPYAKGKKNGSSKTGVLVVFLIIAVMIVLIALYLTTDFLKTPKQLLAKYTLNLVMTLDSLTPLSAEIMETVPSATEVNGDVNIRIEGTMGEEDQAIDGKVVAKTITDAGDSEIVFSTKILDQDMDLSLIKSGNVYAIGSSNLVLPDAFMGKHYVGIRNEDLKSFAKQLLPGSQMVNYFPDQLDFSGLENIFTEEEVNEIKGRYSEIVLSKISEDSLTIEKKVPVTVDGQEIIAKKLYLKINYSVLQDILIESLETLKTDTLLLESYKRVIDIEIDKTKITSAIDTIKESINKESKELANASFVFAMYAADNKTVAVEFAFMKDDTTKLANMKMEIFEGGLAFETYAEQTEFEPSSNTRTVIRIVSSDISETIDVITDVTYDIEGFDNLNSWEDYYREEFKDSKITASYEITSYKKDVGYNDELKINAGETTFKYAGKVAYNGNTEVTTLSDDNAVIINDLNLLEIISLASAFENVFGTAEEEVPVEEDPGFDYSFGDDYLPSDDFSNIETPSEEPPATIDDMDALSAEVDNAISTCETEAANYEEYYVKDFFNDENLKMLCPVIDTVTLISATEEEMTFEVTTISGIKYNLSVGLSGDDITSRSIYRTSW